MIRCTDRWTNSIYIYKVLVGGSQQETLNLGFMLLGTRQQDIPVILRELMLSDRFHPMLPSFIVRDVPTTLFGP
ncbi:unnamed protein product [Schistosoma margrebowiei]|uniref:Uncharacterized protein n=1 Tax=Schistosoma margrebowiei TaxID=48269 RepID=A0A183LVU8_9TREM|nr:unnamed protein product [Schistosoma margrebowiei]